MAQVKRLICHGEEVDIHSQTLWYNRRKLSNDDEELSQIHGVDKDGLIVIMGPALRASGNKDDQRLDHEDRQV